MRTLTRRKRASCDWPLSGVCPFLETKAGRLAAAADPLAEAAVSRNTPEQEAGFLLSPPGRSWNPAKAPARKTG